MGKNIKYQFLNAIEQSFKPGMSKHSAKHEGKTGTNLIFSYADRKNLIDFSANFSNFMKENYPKIKMVKDIKTAHYQHFLNYKAIKCSTRTMETYSSYINKITKVTNKAYHLNKVHNIKTPKGYISSKRNRQMSDEHIDLLLTNTKKGSTTYDSLSICRAFGTRVSEIPKLRASDIIEKKGKLYLNIVDSKGKRDRLAPCIAEYQDYMMELKERYNDGRIVSVQHESINKNVRSLMGKVGIANTYKTTSMHSIRKNYAQKIFNSVRSTMSKKDALNHVSRALGHNDGRRDITQIYLSEVY